MSTASPSANPYPSLAALRAAHAELLKGNRETRNLEIALVPVAEFISRGVATGTLIEHEDDRTTAQSLLDYWSAMVYRSGHEPPDTTLAEFDRNADPELDESLCPYVGLDPFQEEQSKQFFGRGRLTDFLVNKLKNQRMLALVGMVGSGKSSVIRAGLIPALKAGGIEGSNEWRYLMAITPGSSPLSQLAKLLPIGNNRTIRLQNDAKALTQAIAAGGDQPAVLFVDQFDELFTLTEDEQTQEAFIDALLMLANLPEANHIVILTMRSDVESFIARFPDLQAAFERSRVQLLPLGPGELREAIERPAELIGLKFEPGLVDKLIEDLLGEPAALPLLQFTLLELWERRERNRITWAAYNEIGAGRRALAQVAEEFYRSIPADQQAVMRQIMLRLVHIQRGQDVAIKRIRRDILLQSVTPNDLAEKVLGQLVVERLVRVTLSDITADDQIELAHEALARNWPRLIDWLEAERSALETRRRLDARATEWVQLGRGTAGLLDGVQLAEAESWLAGSEAGQLGYDENLPALVAASRTAIEEAQQREVRQAQTLAEAERQRAEAESQRAEEEQRRADAERQRAEVQTRRAEEQTAARRRLSYAFAAIVAMCLIAISMAVVAIDRAGAANTSAIDARIESNTRVAQALVLQTAQLAADQNAQAAESKAAEARTSAALEQVARATAEQASTKADSERATAVKALADVQKRQLESNANELAALAYGSRSKQPQVALLLAAASIQISLKQQSNPVPVAVDTLKTLLTSVTGKGYYQHTGPLTAVAVDAAGRKLVTAGSDGTALIWDPANFAATPTKLDAGNPIVFMGLSADGRYLVTAGTGGDTALLWDLNTPNARSALTLPGNIKALAISPSGRAIALASDSGSTWVWDPAQPSTPIHKLGDRNPALSVALSVDGRWALTGHQDGKARLWDLNGRDPISANFTNSRGYALTSVTFSPDGRWALFGGKSGEAQLWSFSSSGGLTSSAPTLLLGQTATISVIAVSPDSKLAATASDDGSTYVWSLRQGATTPFAVLRLQRGATKAVQFTSDSNRLVTAGASGALSVWDLKAADPGGSGRELIGHDASANAIAISGSLLASVSDDTSLRIWDLSKPAPTEDSLPNNPTDLVALACNVVGRDIQQSEWTSSSVPYQSVCAAK